MAQLSINQRTNLLPTQSAVSATEWRKSHALDTPLLIMLYKGIQAVLDVRQSRRRPPMILGWKIHDQDARTIPVKIRLPKTHLFPFTPFRVVLKHRRVTLFEFLCYAFSHDADAIHGIHACLGLRSE